MSLYLKTPIHQTITLPDDWRECRTAQEIAYWIIAKFEDLGLNELVEDVAALKTTVAGHTTSITSLTNNLLTLVQRVEGDESDIDEINDALTALTARVGTAEEDITTIYDRLDTVDGEIDALDARVESVENDITDIRGRLSADESIINRIDDDVDALDARVESVEDTTTELTNAIQNAQVDIATLNRFRILSLNEDTFEIRPNDNIVFAKVSDIVANNGINVPRSTDPIQWDNRVYKVLVYNDTDDIVVLDRLIKQISVDPLYITHDLSNYSIGDFRWFYLIHITNDMTGVTPYYRFWTDETDYAV